MNPTSAAERFYRVLWPQRAAVLRTARFLCPDADEADELAQEVFIKAFRAINQLQQDEGAPRWLMSILRHTRIDRLRARALHPTISLDGSADTVNEPTALPRTESTSATDPAALLEALSDETLIDTLRQLPEDIRWTILLVDVHGMSHEDAAVIQGVPEGTIKSRSHRGRAMLREALTKTAPMRLAV